MFLKKGFDDGLDTSTKRKTGGLLTTYQEIPTVAVFSLSSPSALISDLTSHFSAVTLHSMSTLEQHTVPLPSAALSGLRNQAGRY